MICPTNRHNDPPGFIRTGTKLEPCPDCGGTMVVHRCDGLERFQLNPARILLR